ncbi:MAG: DUF4932 domain-containing protein [Bacteroidetes bacterium]|nr:MAG: DUF4932 domain-containing protein [Bacteroidota bacterium]
MKSGFFVMVVYALGHLSGVFVGECFGQSRTDNSATYVDEKVTYEIPMAYELMHIAIALTDTTIVSSGYNVYNEVINRNSNYYNAVINHFAPYKNHELIIDLNKALRKRASNFMYNVQLGNNLNFRNNRLEKIDIMPWIRRTYINVKSVNKEKMEDFARTSNFEAFYAKHKEYYNAELRFVQQNSNVNGQQKWLATEFPAQYDNYRIIISPLMGSTHFTQRFKLQGKRKCIMWVASYHGNQQQFDVIEKANYIGLVMTEIDHNYVNPVSDKYKKELNALMRGNYRTKWTNGGPSNSYKTGYAVFNEYMTHAVFLLYTNQIINASEQRVVENSKIQGMTNRRKFIKFAEFYGQLKLLYQARTPNERIADLYPKIIEWCKLENIK